MHQMLFLFSFLFVFYSPRQTILHLSYFSFLHSESTTSTTHRDKPSLIRHISLVFHTQSSNSTTHRDKPSSLPTKPWLVRLVAFLFRPDNDDDDDDHHHGDGDDYDGGDDDADDDDYDKNDRRSPGGTLRQKRTRLNLIGASISINQHISASISTTLS